MSKIVNYFYSYYFNVTKKNLVTYFMYIIKDRSYEINYSLWLEFISLNLFLAI